MPLPSLRKLLLHCLVVATLICVALGARPPQRLVVVSGPLQPASVLRAQGPDSDFVLVQRTSLDSSRTYDHVPLPGLVPNVIGVAEAPHWIVPAAVADAAERPHGVFLAHPRARAPPRCG